MKHISQIAIQLKGKWKCGQAQYESYWKIKPFALLLTPLIEFFLKPRKGKLSQLILIKTTASVWCSFLASVLRQTEEM